MLPTMEKQFEIEENTAPVRHLIDGEEVLYKMREIMPEFKSTEWYENACPKEIMELVDELYNIVLNQPTIEVQEVKRGKWIWLDNDDTTADAFFCSECQTQYITELPDEDPIDFGIRKRDLKHCPNCGAKMDLKE